MIDIGSRLEPFVDDFLIERVDGLSLRLHFVMRDADPYSIRFAVHEQRAG